MVPLSFAGQDFLASRDGALLHVATRTLLVADLHLEKASFFARAGQFLPPYDSRATLDRLAALAKSTDTRRIICLGDNYHDSEGEARLSGHDADALGKLAATCEFIWVVGNHDPDLDARHGGRIVREARLAGLRLRHNIGALDHGEAEISGHYHPQLHLAAGRRRRIRRPCFVASDRRLVMPAFGALTGGMNAADPAISRAMGSERLDALVILDQRLCSFAIDAPSVGARRA